jgi:phage terminase small subunit
MPKKEPVKPKRLTYKQERFVNKYIENKGNATQAVLEAGYDTNIENARRIGEENLEKPAIREAIDKALSELDITPTKILKRFDKEAETADNAMARIRANENLADIADLYPKHNTNLELSDGKLKISWDD